MDKLYYPRPMRSIVYNSPSFKFNFNLQLYYITTSRTSNSSILTNSVKFKTALDHGTGAQVGSIDEKKPEVENLVLLSL